MVLRACRYFGHTRDYWWSTLTWPLYEEMEWELAINPPADRLVALYLIANEMWKPPVRPGEGRDVVEEDEVWESGLPDVTE